MQKLIDQFMETLIDNGLGHMLAWGVFFTLLAVAWKVQDIILKKIK